MDMKWHTMGWFSISRLRPAPTRKLAFIADARRELAEAPVLQHQIVAALCPSLLAAELLGGLRIRVSGTGVELAEAAFLGQ